MSKQRKKGFFSEVDLTVASAYLKPDKRRAIILFGLIGAGLFLAFVLTDFQMSKGRFLSNGPLSSSHAGGTNSCEDCHTSFGQVAPQTCGNCHEKEGESLGVYSFSAHYIYKSGDFRRDHVVAGEMPCTACHPEHQGRDALLTMVPDRRCLTCHENHQFADKHPAFEAVSKHERTTIEFPHVAHVRELARVHKFQDVEQACLACHFAEPDGKHFKKLSFDEQCDSCHLTTSVSTPRLPIAKGDQPGVLTLGQIQQEYGTEALWAYYTNPAEFREVGGRLVSKIVVHHRDPWVMSNLRRWRKQLYPDAGLADLVDAGVTVPPHETPKLYEEAVATLEARALALRARPEKEVQEELARIETQLTEVRKRLRDPYAAYDETDFLLAFDRPVADGVDAATLVDLASQIAKPCTQCHELENLTIARVQTDQRTLRRAEFDHRAHVIQRRCLDCHNKFADGAFTADEIGGLELPASVQNIPDIDTCRACHKQDEGADASCITCHNFHPDQSRRAHLLPYLEEL